MKVIKRDGRIVDYDWSRIKNAVDKAYSACGHDPDNPDLKMYSCMLHIEAEFKDISMFTEEMHVEEIQDYVEDFLIGHDCADTAKAFILYREKHNKQRKAVDVKNAIEEYIGHADWRIKANSNQQYSLGGMILNTAGKITANYWLNEVYPKEIGERHRDGSYHIHDLDMLSGYCCGHSLRALLEEGFNGITGKVSSTPPKHFSTACGQIVNFLGCLQNEWAGAQAFSSFDTYMAPFVRLDNMSLEDIKRELESMIFSLNVGSRWGSQCPFTNLTFDLKCPEDLKNKHPIIGGVEQEFTYGDFQKEMDMINRAFMEVMIQGDKDGRAFTFPIPTYNITDAFDWEHPNCEYLFKMTAKYGNP